MEWLYIYFNIALKEFSISSILTLVWWPIIFAFMAPAIALTSETRCIFFEFFKKHDEKLYNASPAPIVSIAFLFSAGNFKYLLFQACCFSNDDIFLKYGIRQF